MSAVIMDGRSFSATLLEKLKEEISKNHLFANLAVIRIGQNEASKKYVASKIITCNKIGIGSVSIEHDDISETELINIIKELNCDNKINGILVQLPLPDHIKKENIINSVLPSKDVDGIHPYNLGSLIYGNELFSPCTPLGIFELIKYYKIPVEGKNAVIIGRSSLVGKPLSLILTNNNATVTLCHSRSTDLASYTLNADILISAAGRPFLVSADMVKKNACVIDVGINVVNGKIKGDVDFENVKNTAGYITPVPGGIGPMTVAMLMYNTVKAYLINKKT
jgi:methylenetetrahydrofolate dehydrogenase (NADP+)/methenyltetrahydrofolate cyclohydrolase